MNWKEMGIKNYKSIQKMAELEFFFITGIVILDYLAQFKLDSFTFGIVIIIVILTVFKKTDEIIQWNWKRDKVREE